MFLCFKYLKLKCLKRLTHYKEIFFDNKKSRIVIPAFKNIIRVIRLNSCNYSSSSKFIASLVV